jgi:hypothetical protein
MERDMLQGEHERVKAQLLDLEKDQVELQSKAEREKALFDGKVQFLESQVKQAK